MTRVKATLGSVGTAPFVSLLVAVAIAALVGACAAGSETAKERAASSAASTAPTSAENVTRAAYAGTSACARCHADLVAAFERSPMHNMTRSVSTGAVLKSPWDGGTFAFHGDLARFATVGSERRMTLESGGGAPSHRFRLTKVIGGRVREDFVGIELGPEDRPLPGAEERVLPVSWRIDARTWRYKGYSVMTPERSGLRAGAVWRTTCLGCHNTAAQLDVELNGIVSARGVRGRSPVPWPDRLLPVDERRVLVTEDERLLQQWTAAASARALRFGESDLVELGIGCEACHLGSRAHAENPAVHPSPVTSGAAYAWSDPLVASGKGREPEAATDRTCIRCHQVLFSSYEWTWEGGTRARSPGGSTINSGEGRDFLLGGCRGQLTCTACHDPHRGSDPARLAELATPAGNVVCTGCHAKLAGDDAVRAHAHHDPRGEGGSCIACHFPRKNMGLDGRLTRYHRIGTPADASRVLLDRPMECALCHPAKTARSLVETTERWYSRRYDRLALEALYGDLDRPMLLSTLERGKPHEKAVAMDLLGAARDTRAIPLLEAELGDASVEPYPLVRQYARDALERICGPESRRDWPSIDAAGDRGGAAEERAASPEED